MIADLHGRTVLMVAIPPPLTRAFAGAFVEHGATCFQADTTGLEASLERFLSEGLQLDALICGAPTSVPGVAGLSEYRPEDLTHAISGAAWPAFAWLNRVRRVLGCFPRYVIALSSHAPDRFVAGADFSAASEAVLETLCRYASERLGAEDSRMNILRHRLATGGAATGGTSPDEVARAAVALCSGLLDSMRGQVLTVDRGAGFFDNAFRLFEQRAV
jgi:NAD(P)-dependent dehydrogenase (short-subunit alcohol dehydrogenase family)